MEDDFPATLVGELFIDGHRYRIVREPDGIATMTDRAARCHARFAIAGERFALFREASPDDEDVTRLLTERELEIATLVAEGYLNKQIATQLHISEWTVATHLRRIFAKLGVGTRAAMVFRCSGLLGRTGKKASAR